MRLGAHNVLQLLLLFLICPLFWCGFVGELVCILAFPNAGYSFRIGSSIRLCEFLLFGVGRPFQFCGVCVFCERAVHVSATLFYFVCGFLQHRVQRFDSRFARIFIAGALALQDWLRSVYFQYSADFNTWQIYSRGCTFSRWTEGLRYIHRV